MFGLGKKNKIVNVVKLTGVIDSRNKKSLSLENVKKNIDKAFSNKKVAAVAFVINSPGGSPVQSEMIANYIINKSKDNNIKVITFVEDVAASGGYWLALVGDEIYALSKSSIVGSLGVVYANFGLTELIKKHGIERRVHTAGDKKVTLDMFSEEKPEDVVRLQSMLAEVHRHFKEHVNERRSAKLNIKEEDLFSGEFWVASQALNYGLIDSVVSTMEGKLKDLFGDKVVINYIEAKKSKILNIPFLNSFSNKNITDLASEVYLTIKNEQLWNKLGL